MKRIWKYLGIPVLALLAAGIAAPHIGGRRFAGGIQEALQRGLGRKVRIGDVRFSLFRGPGFAVQKVVIFDDPAIGIEPIAYVETVEARPRLWSLWTGRLEFASIRLEDAHINLAKTGPGAAPGRWNFQSLLKQNLIATFPKIHVSNGRINFKFGDTKSVFYLIVDELDISPPARASSAWTVRFSGEPARADRPARGFGSFVARGRWDGSRLDMGLDLDRSAVGEIIALVRGSHAGIHGLISSHVRLAGPLHDLQLSGGLVLEDIHRWDLMPPKGDGWRLGLAGRLNLREQVLDLQAWIAAREALPFSVRFRASDYLSEPRWGVAVNWNRFPAAPLLEVARHMGAQVPLKLRLAGTLDGAIGYSGHGSLQGEVALHDAALTIPDSTPIQFEQARLVFDAGHVHLTPALVRVPGRGAADQAAVEADYAFATQAVDLTISSDAMDVASLRSQAGLAAVPWLEQVRSGTWRGRLRYQYGVERPGWTGRIELNDAEIPLPGLAAPLELESAVAQIQGERVTLERMRAKAGKVRVQGDYRYDPRFTRPHRFRLVFAALDASELEHELLPTLRRSGGLLARALSFGKTPVPDWLDERHMDGNVQIGALTIGDMRLERVRAHLMWDGTRVEIYDLQGHTENGMVTGQLALNLRGARPAYRLAATLKGIECKAGKVDAEALLLTSGIGGELLANLRADLQLSTGAETYTGHGAAQPDGTLLAQLSSGTRELRVSGTLAQLKVDEAGVQ